MIDPDPWTLKHWSGHSIFGHEKRHRQSSCCPRDLPQAVDAHRDPCQEMHHVARSQGVAQSAHPNLLSVQWKWHLLPTIRAIRHHPVRNKVWLTLRTLNQALCIVMQTLPRKVRIEMISVIDLHAHVNDSGHGPTRELLAGRAWLLARERGEITFP